MLYFLLLFIYYYNRRLLVNTVMFLALYFFISPKDIGIGVDLNPIVKARGPHLGPLLVDRLVPSFEELFDFQIRQRVLLAVGLPVLGKVSSKTLGHVRPVAVPALLEALFGKLRKLVLQLDGPIVLVAGESLLAAI